MGNMFLAEIYTNVNQPEKAEKAALKMLQIAESANIESDSLNIYQSKGLVLMFLADFYQKQRRYSEAEKAYDLLIETYSKVTNNKSNEINLAEAYYSFGEFYFNIGKFSECIDFYKKSGEIYLNHFETNPNLFGPKAAIIAKKVGDLLGFAGGLFEQADSFLIIAEHIYNRLNLIDSVWRGSLADVYSIKGKNMALQANPNAERVLNEATDLILETFKSDSAKLSVSLANIEINRGIFFANLKEYKSALDAYKNALYFMLKVKIDADKSFGYSYWYQMVSTCSNISTLYSILEQHDSSYYFKIKVSEYLEKLESEVPGQMTKALIDVYNEISTYELNWADYESARINHQKALNVIQRLEPLTDSVIVDHKINLLCNLGGILVNQNNKDALAYILQSENMIAGAAKYDYLHALNLENLVAYYFNLDLFPDSLEIWAQQSLELKYKLDTLYPGTDDIDIPRTLRNLAYIQFKTQNYTQALANFQKSNELGSMNAEDSYGVNNCEKITNTCYLILECFQNLNQPDSAVQTLKKNYAFLQRCPFQHDHSPDLAYNLLKQMRLQYSYQQHDSAYAAGKRAIAQYENLLSRDTTAFAAYLAEACNTTGVLGLKKEDPNQTMRYFERAAVLYTHIAPLDTQAIEPELAQVYHNIGYLYLATELPRQGIPFTIEAINLQKKYCPELVKSYVQSINQLLLSCPGICPDSLLRVYLLEALQILAESGIDSNKSLEVEFEYHNRLGSIYFNAGKCEVAMNHFRRVAEIYQIGFTLGKADSANYGVVLADIGERYLACGDIPSADSCLNAAFHWFDMLEKKHPQTYKNLVTQKIPWQALRYHMRKQDASATMKDSIDAQQNIIDISATLIPEAQKTNPRFAISLAEKASFLAWHLIKIGKYAEAEHYSRQALLFKSIYKAANKNLALALLLQPGKEQEGLELCRRYADEIYPYKHEAGDTFRDVFLFDFQRLREAGISCPAFEEAEQFLRN